MIIIDGRQAGVNIDSFANLEEILVQTYTECSSERRIVTDVLLNNEPFSEIYPHQAEDIERNEIKHVEIRTVSIDEMAISITDELFKVTRMLSDGSRKIATLFRQGDDLEALEIFQDLLDVTRDFMSTVGVLRTEYVEVRDLQFDKLIEDIAALLGEMSEVLANEDWVLLSDLLEYEFLPVCQSWNAILQTLRQEISRATDTLQP